MRTTSLIHSEDWTCIHTFPEEYFIDEQGGIRSPHGMIGMELGVRVHQIYAPAKTVESIIHSVQKCKLRPKTMVVDSLAPAEALLTDDERELGALIIDLGGTHSTIAAIKNNRYVILPHLHQGGDLITSDIAIGLRTSIKQAEQIKVYHGIALPEFASSEKEIEILPLGSDNLKKSVTSQLLSEIIRHRVEEIFELISEMMLEKFDRNDYPAGVILTGGPSLMTGVKEIAEKYLKMPVMLGSLRGIEGLTELAPDARTASAVGLALYGLRHPHSWMLKQNGTSPFKHFANRLTGLVRGGRN